MTAATLQASSIPPTREEAEERAWRHGHQGWLAWLGRPIRPAGSHRREKPKDAKKPKDEPGGTDTKDGTKADSDLGAAVADPVAAVPNEVAPVSDAVATVSVAVPPVPDVVGPVSDVSALVQDMLTSVAGAVVPLTQLQSDLYSFLLGIASGASVSDLSALVQDLLTLGCRGGRIAHATALRPFFVLVGHRRGTARSGRSGRHPRPWAVGTRRCVGGVAIAAGPATSGVSDVPVTGEATGVATLDVTALGRASAMSGMAPPAPDTASPISAGSSFLQVIGEILLPVSLWALAAGALPGVGGLVVLFATGARLGYRQAKAGFALRAAGIASFARPGAVALGVVRSRSLVVIRLRALRVVRPAASSAGGLLDEVA